MANFDSDDLNPILIWLSSTPAEFRRKMAEGIRRGYEKARDEDEERKLLESGEYLEVYLRILREEKGK